MSNLVEKANEMQSIMNLLYTLLISFREHFDSLPAFDSETIDVEIENGSKAINSLLGLHTILNCLIIELCKISERNSEICNKSNLLTEKIKPVYYKGENMNNRFEQENIEKEAVKGTVKEMITELVYLRKVIDNAVYYGTSISLRATHLIDTILYYHDTGIKDEFTSKELEEMFNQIEEANSEKEFLDLNIKHITDSINATNSILEKLLDINYYGYVVEGFYEDTEEDFYTTGDMDAK